MQTDQLTTGYEICRSGMMLAVLPELLAERGDRRLRRLPLDGCSPLELHAVRRTGGTSVGRADFRLITAVRDRLVTSPLEPAIRRAASNPSEQRVTSQDSDP